MGTSDKKHHQNDPAAATEDTPCCLSDGENAENILEPLRFLVGSPHFEPKKMSYGIFIWVGQRGIKNSKESPGFSKCFLAASAATILRLLVSAGGCFEMGPGGTGWGGPPNQQSAPVALLLHVQKGLLHPGLLKVSGNPG